MGDDCERGQEECQLQGKQKMIRIICEIDFVKIHKKAAREYYEIKTTLNKMM